MLSVAIEQILLSATLAAPALALIYKHRLFPGLRSAWLFLVCCLIVYGLILARVHLIEVRFDAELDAFDLDRDGSFSRNEITPAQKVAMDRVVSDTGRNFAPLTGAILAPVCVAFSFGLVKLVAMAQRYSPWRN